MTDLDAVRARALKASKELINQKTGAPNLFHEEENHRPVRASARDVPELLTLIDLLTPLVVAGRNFVLGDGDKDALEALAIAADEVPWAVLDALGITEEVDA